MKIKVIDMLVKMANNKNYKPTFKLKKTHTNMMKILNVINHLLWDYGKYI